MIDKNLQLTEGADPATYTFRSASDGNIVEIIARSTSEAQDQIDKHETDIEWDVTIVKQTISDCCHCNQCLCMVNEIIRALKGEPK